MFDHLPRIDFGAVQEPISKLILATGHKLEREWPRHLQDTDGAQTILRCVVDVAGNTYRTVLYFCADKPSDPARHLEYAITVPPLARTIVDSLFNVVLLFEDLKGHSHWFHRAGWREIAEEHVRLQSRYGKDPKWSRWLEEKAQFLERTRVDWGITEAEAAKPSLIPRWPYPGQVLKHKQLSGPQRVYLQYLNDWFYRSLSSASHLSWPGLASRSHFFLMGPLEEEKRDELLNKYRSDAVTTTVTLLLALLSEVELHLSFGLGERLAFVWGVMNGYADDARELWEMRYSALGTH